MIELEIFPTKNVDNIFKLIRENPLLNEYAPNLPTYFVNGKNITDKLIWVDALQGNTKRDVSFQTLISNYLPKRIGIDAYEIEEFCDAYDILSEFNIDILTIEKFKKVNYYFKINIPLLGSRESSISITIAIVIAQLTEGLISVSNGDIPNINGKLLYTSVDFQKICLENEYLKIVQ